MSLRPKEYQPRLADSKLERFMEAFGAVEVVGAKWCGKTWTAKAHANSEIRLDNEQTREIVKADLSLAFEGAQPHLIDEWPEVPQLWDATRRAVDDSGSIPGQYILTGSATPKKESVSHSGAGRIGRLKMRPMSLAESGDSSGSVSLAGLFEGEFTQGAVSTDLRSLAGLICHGGWPGALTASKSAAELIPEQYIDNFLSVTVKKKNKSTRTTRSLLLSLARNLGGAVTHETLLADMSAGEDRAVVRQTLESYLEFLEDQYLIEEVKGWDAPIKSKARLRTKPKRSFVDPSIPASLLGLNADRLLTESQAFGQLFEELCLRDLRVYTSTMEHSLPDPIFYYRDADGLEVDAIIELRDGRWAAIEIKLGENKVQEGVNSLMRLAEKIASNPAAQNRTPSFMAVLVGKAEFCRKTPEGIYVVPLTSLGA